MDSDHMPVCLEIEEKEVREKEKGNEEDLRREDKKNGKRSPRSEEQKK